MLLTRGETLRAKDSFVAFRNYLQPNLRVHTDLLAQESTVYKFFKKCNLLKKLGEARKLNFRIPQGGPQYEPFPVLKLACWKRQIGLTANYGNASKSGPQFVLPLVLATDVRIVDNI